MRKVSLIPIAMATCGLFALSAGAQETGKAAKAAASSTPTIDQSLEWKNAFSPKISPDGKRVVYEVQKANWEDNAFDRNLWIVDVATGESHALTSAKKSSINAAWSPDGKWITFLSDRPGQIKDTPEGKKQLYVISADGGEAQQITKTENDVNAFDWAPDSRRIAFSMLDPEPKTLKDQRKIRRILRGSHRLPDGASLDHRSAGQFGERRSRGKAPYGRRCVQRREFRVVS